MSPLSYEPRGGYLPTDVLPQHIAWLTVVPCRTADEDSPSEGRGQRFESSRARYVSAFSRGAVATWTAFFLPKGAPRAIVDKALLRALCGVNPAGKSPGLRRTPLSQSFPGSAHNDQIDSIGLSPSSLGICGGLLIRGFATGSQRFAVIDDLRAQRLSRFSSESRGEDLGGLDIINVN
jgi:hypothetical protein